MKWSTLAFLLSVAGAVDGSQPQPRQSSLEWTECELDVLTTLVTPDLPPIECANLSVPLDYTGRLSAEQLSLQLVRIRATQQPSKGSLLINPGGPGISALIAAVESQALFNSILQGHYDIIGFDPRGVGLTLPFYCNFSSTGSSTNKLKRDDDIPTRNMTDMLLSEGWNKGVSFAEQCFDGNEEIGSFLSTAFVARDMLSIVDALGGDGLLRFWGTSYGTLLGQTFAAMFPDRIDRMFLDSVVDPDDYMTGIWSTYFLDAERSLDNFFRECLAAPDLCALASVPGLNTTEAMHAALAATLEDLLESQITVDVGQNVYIWEYGVESRTLYEHLKRSTLLALYNPSNFITMDTDLTMGLTGNYSYFTQSLSAQEAQFEPSQLTALLQSASSLFGVACLDGRVRARRPEEIVGYVEAQQAASVFADAYGPQYWTCPSWRFEPAERYEGEFTANNTSAPILFSNGLYDPSTPLASARNASAAFPGSALIVHKGLGHSIFAQPSRCTSDHVRAYFLEGVLPDPGTECEPDMPAFELAYLIVSPGGGGTSNETSSPGQEPVPAPAEEESGNETPSDASRATSFDAVLFCVFAGGLISGWLTLM